MAKSRFDPRAISNPRHVRVLASPARHELVDTLSALGGTASVAALAEQLGLHADGLYYHLRVLCRAALVQEIEGTSAGRNGIGSPALDAHRYGSHITRDATAMLRRFLATPAACCKSRNATSHRRSPCPASS